MIKTRGRVFDFFCFVLLQEYSICVTTLEG